MKTIRQQLNDFIIKCQLTGVFSTQQMQELLNQVRLMTTRKELATAREELIPEWRNEYRPLGVKSR